MTVAASPCVTTRASSTARTLAIVADTWTLLILREAFRGTRRFGGWLRTLGIPRPVLAARLARLVDAGVLRRPLAGTSDDTREYQLTEMGRDLWRYLIVLWDWEKHWVPGAARLQRDLRHRRCGRLVRPVICCDHCHRPVSHADLTETPGAGAGVEPRVMPRWQRRATVLPADLDPTYRTQTSRIVGNRWSTMILYAVSRGRVRFGEIAGELGISTQMLAQRLAELVDLAILERVRYCERPPRDEYRLTAKGWALFQSRLTAIAWGDRWLARGKGPPAVLTHRECGHRFTAQLRCSECGEALRQGEFHFEAPPRPTHGARDVL
jgi:DNA-binding HxlR family transcriptional regulator